MLYYKSGRSVVKNYALNFSKINSHYVKSSTFAQWERTQAFTFAWFGNITVDAERSFIFSSARNTGSINNNGRGIRFGINNTTMLVDIVSSFSVPIISRCGLFFNGSFSNITNIIVTYDGSSNISGLRCWINGIEIVSKTIIINDLTTSIVQSDQLARIGFDLPAQQTSTAFLIQGFTKEVSFVNYVKTPAEVLADIAAGTQLGSPADFLFRLPLVFPKPNFNNLNSTVPIKELAQNLDMNLINYPNPLVKGIDLIQI